jgi:hypothetical protein
MSSAEQFRKGMVVRHEDRTSMLTDFFTALSGGRKAAARRQGALKGRFGTWF